MSSLFRMHGFGQDRDGAGRSSREARSAGRAAWLVVAAAALAGCGQQPASSVAVPELSVAGLAQVVRLAAERVMVADQVAAAKLGTGQPVTDPAREAVVVADARAKADREGVDPEWVARVVGDQIAASTQVQNDLLRQWSDHPHSQPTERPDLARVRSEITRISNELVAALKVVDPARAQEACSSSLAEAVAAQARELDASHRAALDRALVSVCDGASN